MPKRSYASAAGYRYGFNGKENDNDVKGLGNQQDYGMRVYDPRLGQFLSVDPLANSYPWYTPYQFAGNKPIWAVDLDGQEEMLKTQINKTEINSSYIGKILDEAKVKNEVAKKIYEQIERRIPSKHEGHVDRGPRYSGEEPIIMATIFENIKVDLTNGYVAVQYPNSEDPGVFYTIAKETINFAFNEAQPIAIQATGAVLYKTGSLIEIIGENVEKYKSKFYKKFYPDKYSEALNAGKSSVLKSSTGLKIVGKIARGGAKILEGVGTV